MRASRQPPSMMELCEVFRKSKEIMLNPDQPVSEIEETLHTPRSPCITPTLVYEHTVETLESGKDRSSDEDCYDFDDGADLLQNRQVCRMKAKNAELRRTAYDEMCAPQRDEERRRRKGIVQRGIYSVNHSHCYASYLRNQAKPQEFICQASCPPNTNTRGACSLQQVQARNEKWTGRQAIRSPTYLQQNMLNMQPEETGPAKRRIEYSNRAVTTLPPIQQRRAMVASPHQSSRRPEEQTSQLLAPGRRYGPQEFCEDRSSEYCKNRRIGLCKETDSTQEHRTFVRVLRKRF